MIVKLLPEQIPIFWDFIKYTKSVSDPMRRVYSPMRMNNLLTSIMLAETEVNMIVDMKEPLNRPDEKHEPKLVGCFITQVYTDTINSVKSYCLYGFASNPDHTISNDMYEEIFNYMCKRARALKCGQIIAYTENPFLLRMAEVWEETTGKAKIGNAISFDVLDV